MKAMLDGKVVSIREEQFAGGGEGTLHSTSCPKIVAKIYRVPSAEKAAKLAWMIAHPPHGGKAWDTISGLAWPLAHVQDDSESFRGYVMPHVPDATILHRVCVPKARQAVSCGITWRYLHAAASNYALAVSRLHARGFVIGDVRTDNVMTDSRAHVTLIDLDSIQVPGSGKAFLCPVASEGFTPPEMIRVKDFGRHPRTPAQDLFGVAVVIFYLLLGSHPFAGSWRKQSDPVGLDELVLQGSWRDARESDISPSPLAIPLEVLHPHLAKCFERCFTDGHSHPERRPSAQTWYQLLQEAFRDLSQCRVKETHFYSGVRGACPWCRRWEEFGVEEFPTSTPVSPKEKLALTPSRDLDLGEAIRRFLSAMSTR